MNESVYARPDPPRIRVRPALATLALHLLLIYVMAINWSTRQESVEVRPQPRVINARLVDVSELRPKPKPQPKPAPKPKAQAKKPAPAAPKQTGAGPATRGEPPHRNRAPEAPAGTRDRRRRSPDQPGRAGGDHPGRPGASRAGGGRSSRGASAEERPPAMPP